MSRRDRILCIIAMLTATAIGHSICCAQNQHIPIPYHVHEPTPVARINLMLVSVFASLWVFVLGSCIGSFLNVVIYRLPAGLQIGKPKSRCPKCETPLTARDNIPILGWLVLRGKCRYCQIPIAARYPIIETISGIIFLGLIIAEIATGGANLPIREVTPSDGNPIDLIFIQREYILLGIYLFHSTLLMLVLATAMIGYDGHKPPMRLLTFGIIVAGVAGMIWPELRPVSTVVSDAGMDTTVLGLLMADARQLIQPQLHCRSRTAWDDRRNLWHCCGTPDWPIA